MAYREYVCGSEFWEALRAPFTQVLGQRSICRSCSARAAVMSAGGSQVQMHIVRKPIPTRRRALGVRVGSDAGTLMRRLRAVTNP